MCHSLRTNDGKPRSRGDRPHDRVGAVPRTHNTITTSLHGKRLPWCSSGISADRMAHSYLL